MSQALVEIAERVGCSERTLRRYVNEGLLRGRRVAAGHGLELPLAEERYLDAHWELLGKLRVALRTEQSVRLAVLFGSTATGEDERDSDVDVVVAHRAPTALALVGLQMRLARAIGRSVDVVGLEQAEAMPTLLGDVLGEGRVLIDRDRLWGQLCARRAQVLVDAEREELLIAAGADAAVRAARERIPRGRRRCRRRR